ncbi:MAG: hypothetical protein K2Y23_22200 [Cyanobacteria bacterium]|nr:hypothetical protein [Cyanobacteriota bacterium]
MAKRDGDGEHAWPLTWPHALEGTNELVEEIVRKEFLDDERHECASPSNPVRARRKELQRAWTELRPPPLGIELLFRPKGGFELLIDLERDGMDLAHGSTSTESARERCSRVVRCGGPGPPAD